MRWHQLRNIKVGLVWLICGILTASVSRAQGFESRDGVFSIPDTPLGQVLFIPSNPEYDLSQRLSLDLLFPYGEANNPYEEGMAHYVEHLAWLSAFQPKDSLGDDQDVRSHRHSNAWTAVTNTRYRHSVEPDALSAGIERLLRVASPLSDDEAFMHEERLIVLREHSQRTAGDEMRPVDRALAMAKFGEHPLMRSVIGEPRDITQFSLARARALHAASHRLDQATLVIYGDIDLATVQEALEAVEVPQTAYNLWDGAELPSLVVPPALTLPKLEDGETLYRDFDVERLAAREDALLMHQWYTSDIDCSDLTLCEILAAMAEGALNAPTPFGLQAPLYYDAFLAEFLSVSVTASRHGFVKIEFYAVPDLDVTIEHLEQAYLEALGSRLNQGVDDDTYAYVEGLIDRLLLDRDDLPDFHRTQVLSSLGRGIDIRTKSDWENAYDKVTLPLLNDFLGMLSMGQHQFVRHVLPDKQSGD